VSHELSIKIRLALEELAIIRDQFQPLISMPSDAPVGVIETAAACAMLHSFYTEIEKILKISAREWDGQSPSSDSWHKDLLIQMSQPTDTRPAVVSTDLVEVLSEFLAFRHLFRGASIVLMRWEKLVPLISKVDRTYNQTRNEIGAFVRFLDAEDPLRPDRCIPMRITSFGHAKPTLRSKLRPAP
jgi:hypothetical protein